MEFLSEIVCGILGFLAGFSCKVIVDKSKKDVYKVTQKDIDAGGDVVGRDKK